VKGQSVVNFQPEQVASFTGISTFGYEIEKAYKK